MILIIQILNGILAISVGMTAAYDCMAQRFPITIGGTDGGTEVRAVVSEGSAVYYAGTTQDSLLVASGESQSVFFGMYDTAAMSHSFTKRYGASFIHNVETMAMEPGSGYFVLLVSSNTQTNAYWLIRVNKNTGSTNRQARLDLAKISGTDNMYGKALSDAAWSYSLLSMNGEANIYLGLATTTEDHMGIIKMQDFSSNNKIDWYSSLACSQYCRMTSIQQSSASSDFVYAASIYKDAVNTYGQLHHFDSLGNYHWTQEYTMGASSLSDYLIARTMLSTSSGSKLVLVQDSSGSETFITIFDVSSADHSQKPSTFSVYTLATSNAVHKQMWAHSSNSGQVFLLQSENDSISKLVKLDLNALKYKAITIPMSSGSAFKVNFISKNAQGASDGDFFYAGKTSQATDGSINQAFSQSQGFIQMSLTSNSDINCLSDITNYDPDLSAETAMTLDATQTWSDPAGSYTWQTTVYDIQAATNTLGVQNALIPFGSSQYWCTRAAQAIIVDPVELTNGITYTSQTTALDTHFTFGFNDTQCDARDFSVTMNCTWEAGNWSTIPELVQDSDNSYHVHSYTSDNLNCGSYLCDFSVTDQVVDSSGFTHNLTDVSVLIIDPLCSSATATSPAAEQYLTYNIKYNASSPQEFSLSPFTFDASTVHCFTKQVKFTQPNNSTFIDNTGSTAIRFISTSYDKLYIQSSDNNHESYGADKGWIYILEQSFTNVVTGAVSTHTIKVEIVADCWMEQVTMPSTINFVDFTYTIFGDPQSQTCVDMENWSTSRESCHLQYVILTDGSECPDFAYIEPGVAVWINSTNNQYGGKTDLKMDYTGRLNISTTNNQYRQLKYTFYGQTIKDCSSVDYVTSPPTYHAYWPNGKIHYKIQTGRLNYYPMYLQSPPGCDQAYSFFFTNGSEIGVLGETAIHQYVANNHSNVDTLSAYVSVQCSDNRASFVVTNSTPQSSVILYVKAYNYYYNSTTWTSESPLSISWPIEIFFRPNCALESATVVTAVGNQTHTIYSGNQSFTIPQMSTTLTYCSIWKYQIVIDGVDIDNTTNTVYDQMFNFSGSDLSNMQLFVEINDNLFGGQEFKVDIVSYNWAMVKTNQTFYLTAIKNCQYAELLVYYYNNVTPSEVNYTINQAQINVPTVQGYSNDSYCALTYTHYFTADNSSQLLTTNDNCIYYSQVDPGTNIFSVYCTDSLLSKIETDYHSFGSGVVIRTETSFVDQPFRSFDGSNMTQTVHFLPDCSGDTISTGIVQADDNYKIYDTAHIINIEPMVPDTAFCIVDKYNFTVNGTSADITDSSTALSSYLTFDIGGMQLTVYSENNQWGNQEHTIHVRGTNIYGTSHSHTFILTLQRNCEYATLTKYEFDETAQSVAYTLEGAYSIFPYTVEDPLISIFLQNAESSDPYCYRFYELYYQDDPINNPGVMTLFDAASPPLFISALNTLNTDTNTSIHFDVYATDQSFLQQYQLVNITITIKMFINRDDFGSSAADQVSSTILRVGSFCKHVIFSSTPLQFDYFIRNGTQSQSIDQIQVSYPGGTKTTAEIHTQCGYPTYVLWNTTTDSQITDFSLSLIDSFTEGQAQSADPLLQKSILTYSSANQHEGGSYDAINNVRTNFKQYDMALYTVLKHAGMSETYWDNVGFINITLYARDECWTTDLYEGPLKLNDSYPAIKTQLISFASKFLNTASDNSPDHQTIYNVTRHDCGPIIYSLVYLNQTSGLYQQLESNWTYWDQSASQIKSIFQIDYTSYPNELELKIYAFDESFIGYWPLAVNTTFEWEPMYPTKYFPFQVKFRACEISSIYDPTVVQSQEFNIWGGRKRYVIDFLQLYQIPNCIYPAYYTSSLKNDPTGGYTGQNSEWPGEIIKFVNGTTDATQSMYYEVYTEDLNLEGKEYDFVFTITFVSDYNQNELYIDATFNIEWKLKLVYFPVNDPPEYPDFGMSSQVIQLGQRKIVSTGKASTDTRRSEWRVKDESKEQLFLEFTEVSFDRHTYEYRFNMRPYKEEHQSTYNIEIMIEDQDPPERKKNYYQFFFIVIANELADEQPDEEKIEDDVGKIQKDVVFAVQEMDNKGKVKIAFSETMNYQQLEYLKSLDSSELKKHLLVSIIPAPNQDPSKVTVESYQIIDISNQSLTLQLTFHNAQYISLKTQLDQLSINFINKTSVQSSLGQNLAKSYTYFTMVPQQIGGDDQQFLQGAVELQNGMQGTTLIGLIQNVVWQYPVNNIWGMINALQITSHCQLINTEVPSNVAIFNNITMKLIYFDILIPEYLEKFYFWKLFDGSYNKYEEEGYEDVLEDFRLLQSTSPLLFEEIDDDYEGKGMVVWDKRILESDARQVTNYSSDQIKQLTIQQPAIPSTECTPDDSAFCNLKQYHDYTERKKFVSNILKERNKTHLYTDAQVDALAAYEPPSSSADYEMLTQLEKMAYGSTSLIENMGTVFVILMLFLFYVIAILLARLFCIPFIKNKGIRRYHSQIQQQIFWGSFIRLGLEIYMEAAISVQINIINYQNNKGLSEYGYIHNEVSYFSSIVLAIILVLFMIISAVFLYYNQVQIYSERYHRSKYLLSYSTAKSKTQLLSLFSFYERYSSMFDVVNPKYLSKIVFYPLFMLRRLLLSVILVHLQEQPQFQTMLITFLNLFYTMYLCFHFPLEERKRNRIEIFGEIINMMVCYNFFVFSDFVPDIDTRSLWGYTSITYVSALVIVNMVIICIDHLNSLISWYERRQREKQQQKREQKHKEMVENGLKQMNTKQKQLAQVVAGQITQGLRQQEMDQMSITQTAQALSHESLNTSDQKYRQGEIEIGKQQDEDENSVYRLGRYNRFADMVAQRIQKEKLQSKLMKAEKDKALNIQKNSQFKNRDKMSLGKNKMVIKKHKQFKQYDKLKLSVVPENDAESSHDSNREEKQGGQHTPAAPKSIVNA